MEKENDTKVILITEKELIDIVCNLNDDIYDHFDVNYDGGIYFEYRTIGNASIITFLGLTIWCSEEEGYEITPEDIISSANALIDQIKSIPRLKYSKTNG